MSETVFVWERMFTKLYLTLLCKQCFYKITLLKDCFAQFWNALGTLKELC